jgi:DNA-binding phage protein
MPIVGLSERNRLARTGQFKIGERTERGFPRALDHFRIVGGAEAVEAVYGPKPKAVTVYLPLDLGPEVWDPYYKRYGASGLQCKGDGLVGREVGPDGSLKERDCAQRGCPFAQPTLKNGKEQPPLCKPVGILAFQVVGVPGAGVYQIAVKGLSALARVDSYLRALEAAAGGSLKGVPFVLKVEQTKGKDGFPTSRILVADAPETAAVLQGAPRYPRTAPVERVRGYAVLSERGELIATPEVRVGEDLQARAALAERLHAALEEGLIPAEHVQRYREMVAAVGNMSEAEAAEKLERLEAWLQNQGKAA